MSKRKDSVPKEKLELPKNIQQIGKTGTGIKIYLEDYCGTYLRRILGGETNEHAILLGRRQTDNKQTYMFIKAVISVVPEEKEKSWKYDWNHIYEVMQKYFIEEGNDKPEILGWAMAADPDKKISQEELGQIHKANFEHDQTVAFLMELQEGTEQFYIMENNCFHSIEGYYIYYDTYKPMQKYVNENQPGPCVETEMQVSGCRESYRTILQKRKDFLQRRQTVSFLYVASTFLVMIVIVLGVTTMNHYDKMKRMQAVIEELSTAVLNEENKADSVQAETMNAAEPGVVSEDSTVVMSTNVVSGEAASASEWTGGQETDSASGQTNGQEEAVTNTAVENAAAATTQPKAHTRYEIQPGDTLASISMKLYNTEQMVDKICKINGIENGDQIVAGDMLILP